MHHAPISISDHFTAGKILRFALPSILMMMFTSMYTIVDGITVSNLVGPDAFSSLNLIWPAVGMVQAFGFTIGAGGTAYVSKLLGEQRKEKACEVFTMLIVFEVLAAIVISAILLSQLVPVSYLMGANDDLLADCILYGAPLIAMQFASFLSVTFPSFLITVGRQNLGLALTIVTGVLNMVLDFVFVGGFHMGIFGAAAATALNWLVGAAVPLVWFWRHQEAPLHFVRFSWDFKALGQSLFNGSSEMVTNLSASFVLMIYNGQLMRLAGAPGVQVNGILQYVLFLATGMFYGYTMAVAPCVGYQYGAKAPYELKNLLRLSLWIVLCGSLAVFGFVESMASLLCAIFVSGQPATMELGIYALHIYALSFLVTGFNIFVSGFFTALNNGVISAALSLLRTFVFQVAAILLLPLLFGLNGVWYASVAAEVLSAICGMAFLLVQRRRYGY